LVDALLAKQRPDLRRRLRALADPVLDALFVDDDLVGIVVREVRVVVPQNLDEPAIARERRFGRHKAEGVIVLAPRARETDLYHVSILRRTACSSMHTRMQNRMHTRQRKPAAESGAKG